MINLFTISGTGGRKKAEKKSLKTSHYLSRSWMKLNNVCDRNSSWIVCIGIGVYRSRRSLEDQLSRFRFAFLLCSLENYVFVALNKDI
jgi:hypothetical protein